MGNCYTCAHCREFMTGYRIYQCAEQEFKRICNKDAECPYYKKSLIDKIIDFFGSFFPEKKSLPPSDNLSPPPRPEPPKSQGGI